jgi:uncharacterized NAD(P)/FAD-binding protein YdhS
MIEPGEGREYSLAIVGGGPMCTYTVERLAALLPDAARPPTLRISIFERTGRFGAGQAHSDVQPRTNYMNRIAGQIALAADESNEDAGDLLPRRLRPTFLEWCRARFEETGDARFDLGPRDVPRRYLHGLALREAFDRYVALLRSVDGVAVDLHAAEVVDVSLAPDGLLVHGSSFSVPADRIVFVTGHSWNRPAPGSVAARLAAHREARYVACAYPLDQQVTEEAIPPGCAVGVRGLGLTAMDVMLHLTEGRGGTFVEEAGRLAYVRSGREPATIVGFGPSGMLVCCRPVNAKEGDRRREHQGAFFTREAVRALRESVGVGPRRQLDFDRHCFPLVVLEMAYVYYSTAFGPAFAAELREWVDERYRAFLETGSADRDTGITFLSEPVEECVREAAERAPAGRSPDRFDWRAIHDPLPAESARDGEDWRARVVAFMRSDLANGAQGNLANPVKAACDGVWRDLRAVFNETADRGGLLPDSQRRFASTYLRYYNRLSNGAGVEATRKVLALVEDGLVDVSVGPEPVVEPVTGEPRFRIAGGRTGVEREVDVVVEGWTHPFDPELDASPLYPNLLRRGLVRRWGNGGFEPGGLDVTDELHPVGADGTVDERLTFLGAPVEGVLFFQTSAARPYSNSYVLNNVARRTRELVDAIEADARRPAAVPAHR